ncbi:hypothetical protein ACNVED_05555 [Legionella sp. D16C41]|uniref:hypothetical protein n=1 Tax=Legionella sp. D16C41 TaxID=3402688 RepID=UPI003AF64218
MPKGTAAATINLDLLKRDKELQQNISTANTFEDLPKSVKQQLQTKEAFENFLSHYPQLGQKINIEILVNQAIKLESIEVAVLLITKNYFDKLKKDSEQFKKLLLAFQDNLQWLHTVSSQLSLSKLIQISGLDREDDFITAIKEFKAKTKDNVIPIRQGTIINNLFKEDNKPWAKANLAYFIENPKPCSAYLQTTHLNDMFKLADIQQVLALCWALVKTRIKLLKIYLTTSERNEGELKDKIKTSLTTKSSKQATDFITYEPSVMGELFKSALEPNRIDLATFKTYLLLSHKPRQIIKAYGDLIVKADPPQVVVDIKQLKKLNQVVDRLRQNNSIADFATNFHLLTKFKINLLKQALEQPEVQQDVITKLTGDKEHKEWVIMHLKENPSLVKALCKNNANNFLQLLPLTDDPGELLRKVAGKIDSKDRARIIFQSVIQIGRYTKEHPEYQAEFDKMLEEKFWLNFGYRSVRSIAIAFLTDELRSSNRAWVGKDGTKDDLKFLIKNKNLHQLFNLTEQQCQQLAKDEVIEQKAHKALAEHYYGKLNLGSKKPQDAQAIRDKSIHYVLKEIDPEFREVALNEAIYGVRAENQHDQTKKLISLARADLFQRPLAVLQDLSKADVECFYTYFNSQIKKINTIDELDILAARFNGEVKGKNLAWPISERRQELIQNELRKEAEKSLSNSANKFYNYAKHHTIEALLILGLGITNEEVIKRVAYGAITHNDLEFIKARNDFKSILLDLMEEKDFQRNADVQIAQVLLDNVGDNVLIIDVITKLDPSVPHPVIDQYLKDSPVLMLACLQLKGEWNIEHINSMLAWFDKNNLTHAKAEAKRLLFTQGPLLTLMQSAQSNSALRDDLLVSNNLRRFTQEKLTDEETKVFLAWYRKVEVSKAFKPLLTDILVLNQESQEFINELIGQLSDGARLKLLKDPRIDSTFIGQNPSLLLFKKPHYSLEKELINDSNLLSKVVHIFPQLPKDIKLFTKEQIDLFLKVLNQEELLNGLQVETRAAFDEALLPLLSEPALQKALLENENKAAAIAIVTSKNEQLREAFWLAAKTSPKLVGQVIEAILDNASEINKHQEVIKSYFDKFSSDKVASSVKNTSAIQNILKPIQKSTVEPVRLPSSTTTKSKNDKPTLATTTTNSLDESSSLESDEKNSSLEVELKGDTNPGAVKTRPRSESQPSQSTALTKINIEVNDIHYVEDIYKLLLDYRNVDKITLAKYFEVLRTAKPELFEAALKQHYLADYTISSLLKDINDELPKTVAKSVSTIAAPQKKAQAKKKVEKAPKPKLQDENYSKYQKIVIEIKEKSEKEILKIKKSIFNSEQSISETTKKIKKIFKNLNDEANSNVKDTASSFTFKKSTVLAAYQAIKYQYRLLEDLQKNSSLPNLKQDNTLESCLTKVAEQYNLGSKEKLNNGLRSVLHQANIYLENSQHHLAAHYYHEVIKACKEDEDISLQIRFDATKALISLLIKEPDIQVSPEAPTHQHIKNLFQSFIGNCDFTSNFIKPKILALPPEWLASSEIYEVIENNLNLDNPNLELVEWIEKHAKVTHTDKILNQNFDTLKKMLELKVFVNRHQDSDTTTYEQSELLKEIYHRDPELLFNEKFNFNLEVVLATTGEGLEILFFYLRNRTLAANLLEQAGENIQALYELGKQNELVKFVLTSCYPHVISMIDQEVFTHTIVITRNDDTSSTTNAQKQNDVNSSIFNTEVSTDEPLAPPPPPPPGPPPPPPPSNLTGGLKLPSKTHPVSEYSSDKPTNNTGSTSNTIISQKDIAKVKLKSVTSNQDEKNRVKGPATQLSLAEQLEAKAIKQKNLVWQEMTQDGSKELSTCGQAILNSLKVPVNAVQDVPADAKEAFYQTYVGIKSRRLDDINVELVFKELRLNQNLKAYLVESEEKLTELAKQIAEVAKAKKSLEMKETSTSKPVSNHIPSSSANVAIKEILTGLGAFLGHTDQAVIAEPLLIELYKDYSKPQETPLSVEKEADFIKRIAEILQGNMTLQTKERIEEVHSRTEKPGPSVEKTVNSKAELIFTKMKALNKPKRTTVSPQEIAKALKDSIKFNPLQPRLENADVLYNLEANGKKVFTKEGIKKALGNDNLASLNQFEAKIWEAIGKIKRGNRISKDILLGSLYKIANQRDNENFTKDFNEEIWEHIKIFATAIGKPMAVVDQFEQKAFLAAPTIDTLYTEKVFNKENLALITKKDNLSQLESLLADKINFINLNKPVFRDELWNQAQQFLMIESTADKEKAFNEHIWEPIRAYTLKKYGHTDLAQEKDLEKETRRKACGNKFFSQKPRQEENNKPPQIVTSMP